MFSGNGLITSDNLELSLVTILPAISQPTLGITLSENAHKYLLNSKSKRTRQGYKSDLKHFAAFCHSQNVLPLPAAPATVAAYLVMLAEGGFKPATMIPTFGRHLKSPQRRPTRLPGQHEARRRQGSMGWHQAHHWNGANGQGRRYCRLFEADAGAGARLHSPASGTDPFFLLTFAGALRRSELVALNIQDVAYVPEGLVVNIRSSKTDQERAGQKVAVAFGKIIETCPVRSLRAWVKKGAITKGPLFRGVTRWGRVQDEALSDQVVALLVKKYARLAGLDATLFSGHSLRAGLATSASKIAGVDERIIMKQTRHKSEAMVRRYIRDANLFNQNVSAMVGL